MNMHACSCILVYSEYSSLISRLPPNCFLDTLQAIEYLVKKVEWERDWDKG